MSTRRTGPLRFDAVGVAGAAPAHDDTPAADTATTGAETSASRAASRDQNGARASGFGMFTRLAALIVMVALIELLPVQAWLMTLAAYQTGDARLTAAPFWLVALTLAGFAVGGRLMANGNIRLRVGAGIVVGVVAFTGALLWPTGAFAASSPGAKPVAFIGLAALVAYLGWRGVGGGATVPFAVAFERFRRIFTYGLAAMVGASTISIAAPPSARAPLIGALGLFLPIEIFAGLLALAISKAALQRANALGAETALPDETRWLGMAVGLASLVMVVALTLSVIVSFPTISVALTQFGSFGALLNTALSWFVDAVVFILYLIFTIPISLLKRRNTPLIKPTLPQPCVQHTSPTTPKLKPGQFYCSPAHTPTLAANVVTSLVVIGVVIVAVAVLFILFLLIRDLVRRGARLLRRPTVDADEEREDLDARGLLSAQLRGLLGGRSRRAPPEEALPQGSVRWLYREALRAAAGRGVARAPNETPDEFARRLAPILGALAPAAQGRRTTTPGAAATADGQSQADFADLSDAYNRARYADEEPTADAHGALRERATRLIRRLRGDSRRR